MPIDDSQHLGEHSFAESNASPGSESSIFDSDQLCRMLEVFVIYLSTSGLALVSTHGVTKEDAVNAHTNQLIRQLDMDLSKIGQVKSLLNHYIQDPNEIAGVNALGLTQRGGDRMVETFFRVVERTKKPGADQQRSMGLIEGAMLVLLMMEVLQPTIGKEMLADHRQRLLREDKDLVSNLTSALFPSIFKRRDLNTSKQPKA